MEVKEAHGREEGRLTIGICKVLIGDVNEDVPIAILHMRESHLELVLRLDTLPKALCKYSCRGAAQDSEA